MQIDPEQLLEFWFPANLPEANPDDHKAFWQSRMRGGMDDEIIARFGPATESAARGELNHWAETPRGRQALLLLLDQFPRSYWRGTPAAYGQDMQSARLVMEALENGHYAAIEYPWERQFFIIALVHCEGPDHLARMDLAIELSRAHSEIQPPSLSSFTERAISQATRVRDIIARFGRHPHRNEILGRMTTVAEVPYLEEGNFPHERKVE